MYEVEVGGRVVTTSKLYDAICIVDSYGRPTAATISDNEAYILLKRDGKEIQAVVRYPPAAREAIEYELFGRGLL